ncbi:MAG: hypothetical protein ABSD62_04445 [Candidatus Limnocylindrales bacterium]|jgi:hypothetical protein
MAVTRTAFPARTLPLLLVLISGAGACNPPAAISTPTVASLSPTGAPTPLAVPSATRGPMPDVVRCQDRPAGVALIVDPQLAPNLAADLQTFGDDLCADGYGVRIHSAVFGSPPELRTYLAQVLAETQGRLEGAILIGDFPHAYQFDQTHPDNPKTAPVRQEVLSLQYYSDLDGVFAASADYTYEGRHEYSYNQHTGDTDWEIWVGVLPYYRGDASLTIDAMHRYFRKNHAYRQGERDLPRGFLEINEQFSTTKASEEARVVALMRTGPYSWTPFSNGKNSHLYVGGVAGTIADGYADLSAGVVDFAVMDTHGTATASGAIDIAWVESHPVRAYFFWSDACSIGDIEEPENFATSLVYSETSSVLVAKGNTRPGSGLGTNKNGFYGHNIATGLTSGWSLGRAVVEHVRVPLIDPWAKEREHLVSPFILIGDPTLRRE